MTRGGLELVARLDCVPRLAEHRSVPNGHLVRSDNDSAGITPGDRFGLRLRQAGCQFVRLLPAAGCFVDFGRDGLEGQAEALKQGLAMTGSGCENEHADSPGGRIPTVSGGSITFARPLTVICKPLYH